MEAEGESRWTRWGDWERAGGTRAGGGARHYLPVRESYLGIAAEGSRGGTGVIKVMP